MRRRSSLVVLLLALVMGGMAAYLAREWLQTHSMAVAAETTIVVANGTLALGAPIAAESVREVSWPANVRPEGAFSSVRQLLKDGRRLALSPLVRDEPIVASKVSAPNGSASLSTIIDPGMRAVTVPVDDVRGVAGFISPRDFVDVALTRADINTGPVSDLILQHVKVLAIDQFTNEHQDGPRVAKAVTLEVSPEDALKTLLAVNVGKLSLILRPAAELAVAPEERVIANDLYPTPATPKTQMAATPALPLPDADLVKVVVGRAMKSDEYKVPRG